MGDDEGGFEASLTLPSGQALRVITERQGAEFSEELRAQSETVHDTDTPEGMALGSWTGGSIWESGEVLARLLCAQQSSFWVEKPRVLELGCGCGLLGLAAAGCGAEAVVLTDQVTFMAEHNLAANFPPDSPARARTRVTQLRWGNSADAQALSPPFDLLLGSDLIYHRDHHPRLVATLGMLSGPNTTILWATPDGGPNDTSRPAADGRASIGYNVSAAASFASSFTSLPLDPLHLQPVQFYERMRRSGWCCEDITDAPEVAAIVEEVMPADEFTGNRGRADTNWGRGDIRVARMTRAARL